MQFGQQRIQYTKHDEAETTLEYQRSRMKGSSLQSLLEGWVMSDKPGLVISGLLQTTAQMADKSQLSEWQHSASQLYPSQSVIFQ